MKIFSRTTVSLLALSLLLFSAVAFAAETPAAKTPAAEKPAVEKPAADKPAAETPAVQTPAADKPAVEKPAAEKPAVETPAVKLPDPVNFGKDANKMQWYLVNYGKGEKEPFAVARKYYTNPDEKQKTADLIATKFGIEKERASEIYFTQYRYVYSADGKQFALAYIQHYDMIGNIINSTEYEGEDRVFYGMTKGMIPLKAYDYASGKLPAQKKAPAKHLQCRFRGNPADAWKGLPEIYCF